MKRKIVNRLLAGCLAAVLVVPSAVWGAEEQQTNADQPGITTEGENVVSDITDDMDVLSEQSLDAAATAVDATAEDGSGNAAQPQAEVTPEVQTPPHAAGWAKEGNYWVYYYSDGTSAKSKFEDIEGKTYYFDQNGHMLTGWQKIETKWYYFESGGAMVKNRWLTISGKDYYFYANGIMASDEWVGEYYVNASGAWEVGRTKESITAKSVERSGWIQSGNRWWYRHSDGSYTKSNWEKINGRWYYFDANGWMITGWKLISGNWYYMDASGMMVTGWQKVGGSWYYMNTSGAMLTGWQWIGSKSYYFYNSGVMAAATWVGNYYVDGSGAWVQSKSSAGWVQSGNRWWYRHSDGSYTKSNWEKIEGKWYYFDASGWMLTGWQKIGQSWYYLNGSGAMHTGWVKLGGGKYYLNASGAMLTGWQKIDGKWYYLNSSGVLATDTWIGNFYVDEEGVWKEGYTGGWVQSANRWTYVNPGGSNPKSTWKTISGTEYYFDAEGWMVTGWLKSGSNWYYLKESGAKAYDYWVGATGVGGYYVSKYGTMVAGTTYSYGDYIYTFNGSGLCTAREVRYIQAKDANGKTYKVEKQYSSDPQVGKDVTEDEFLAAAVYAESGNQGLPGMTGVALVMLNRMENASYPSQANIMIYQATQFEVARNGALTRYLNNINASYMTNAKAAVKAARATMAAYKNSGTPRTVSGLTMPAGKKDFNYMGFMTPAAFTNANLDWNRTEAFTYLNTTFYTTWIKKS